MKKKLFFIALMATAMSTSSFAGNGDLPKIGPPNETEITLNIPNDDPNAPPPPTYTYYTVKKFTSSGMTINEKNAEPNYSWNSSLTVQYNKTGGTLSINTYLATLSKDCAIAFLNSSMCTGCHTWGTYYSLGSSVTTSSMKFVPECGSGGPF